MRVTLSLWISQSKFFVLMRGTDYQLTCLCQVFLVWVHLGISITHYEVCSITLQEQEAEATDYTDQWRFRYVDFRRVVSPDVGQQGVLHKQLHQFGKLFFFNSRI